MSMMIDVNKKKAKRMSEIDKGGRAGGSIMNKQVARGRLRNTPPPPPPPTTTPTPRTTTTHNHNSTRLGRRRAARHHARERRQGVEALPGELVKDRRGGDAGGGGPRLHRRGVGGREDFDLPGDGRGGPYVVARDHAHRDARRAAPAHGGDRLLLLVLLLLFCLFFWGGGLYRVVCGVCGCGCEQTFVYASPPLSA